MVHEKSQNIAVPTTTSKFKKASIRRKAFEDLGFSKAIHSNPLESFMFPANKFNRKIASSAVCNSALKLKLH